MHLTPREKNRLEIFTAAELARRRLARGRPLNVPESIALISDEVLELAWDGASLADVIAGARSVLGPADVMDGVREAVRHLEIDALFPSGTALVAVDDPIGTPTAAQAAAGPGAVLASGGTRTLNAGRRAVDLDVENTGAETVFVSSHYHFFECNPALEFDRSAALGMRLDIAAGSAVRWLVGERRRVRLVELGGAGVAYGFRGLVQGAAGRAGPAAEPDAAAGRAGPGAEQRSSTAPEEGDRG
ncbi:MAG TPA: urease subunit beta [Streptosporangiaceae bacterium]|jgi:urease subunit gamma/beta